MEKTNDKPDVKCCDCGWSGVEDDLMHGEDKDGHFRGCPNCKTDNYLSDICD